MPIASPKRGRAEAGDRRCCGAPHLLVALVVALGLLPVIAARGQGDGAANPAAVTGLEIAVVDEAGAPIGGGCFGLVGPVAHERVCDDGDLDGDPRPGVVLIVGIAAGMYVVRDVLPPHDFEAAEA